MVTIADCERVQTAWFRFRAERHGGTTWEDDGQLWVDGPDGMNLMFPAHITAEAVSRALDRAREGGHRIVGAWLGLGVDAGALADAGFESGWSPWWMTARLVDVPDPVDMRVRLESDPSAPIARRAVAHDGVSDRTAGSGWSFDDGNLTGVFDMEVAHGFRRRGLGTALLGALCAAARRAGGTDAVLNATPDGKALYETCGFRQIGEGITWWRRAPGG